MPVARTAVVLVPVVLAAGASPAAAQTAGDGRPATALTAAILDDRERHVLQGRAWRVRVRTDAPATGVARIRVARGSRTIVDRTVALAPTADGRAAEATLRVRSGRPGLAVVRASLPGGQATVQPDRARTLRVRVVAARARRGSRGLAVRILQRELRRKGYVPGRPGVYDARTARAVLAFHKVTGRRRTSVAGASDFALLGRGGGTFRARFPRHGRHAEGDIGRQVLVLFGRDGRTPERIYPTSTGKRSTPTIRGSFRVYRKEPGRNRLGMIHSVYFRGGYAIHGYKSVPTFPASAGCLRVPPADARAIYDRMPRGMRVDTYR